MTTHMPYDDDDLDGLDDEFADLHEETDDILEGTPREPIAIETTIQALRESEAGDGETTDTIYLGLSNLNDDDLAVLIPVWRALDTGYRQRLLSDLTEASETTYELDYSALGRVALKDANEEIRAEAIGVMWHDQSIRFMRELMAMAAHDPGDLARAAALSALGAFILAGELDDLPIDETNEAQALAVAIYHDEGESIAVRRRALEALSNSSNDNVNPAIEAAMVSDDVRMRISAVHAMGKSCDDRWQKTVLNHLKSDDPEMLYEAAKAAGELQINGAVPLLAKLTEEEDAELQEAAIWALGEIGGTEATRILARLLKQATEDEDEALIAVIEEAIGNASVLDGSLTMFRMDD